MYGFKNISTLATLAALLTFSAAAPTSEVEGFKLEKRNTAIITMFSADTCTGNNRQFVEQSGDHCIPVPFAVRSIHMEGSGCTVHTYSGTDCGGSEGRVDYGACGSWLYGSVRAVC